jgi:hypothetical protein
MQSLRDIKFKNLNILILKNFIFFSILGVCLLIYGHGLVDDIIIGIIASIAIFRIFLFKKKINFNIINFENKIFFIIFFYLLINSFYGAIVNNDFRILRYSLLFVIYLFLILLTSYHSKFLKKNIDEIYVFIIKSAVFSLSLILLQGIIIEIKDPTYLARYSSQGILFAGSSIFVIVILIAKYPAYYLLNLNKNKKLIFFFFFLCSAIIYYFDSRFALVLFLSFYIINFRIKNLLLIFFFLLGFIFSFSFDFLKPIVHSKYIKEKIFEQTSAKDVNFIINYSKYYSSSFLSINNDDQNKIFFKLKISEDTYKVLEFDEFVDSLKKKTNLEMDALFNYVNKKYPMLRPYTQQSKKLDQQELIENSFNLIINSNQFNKNIYNSINVIANPHVSDLDRKYSLVASYNKITNASFLNKIFGFGFYSHRTNINDEIKILFNKKIISSKKSTENFESYNSYIESTGEKINYDSIKRISLLPALIVDGGFLFVFLFVTLFVVTFVLEIKNFKICEIRTKFNKFFYLLVLFNLTYINYFLDVIVIFLIFFIKDIFFYKKFNN